ncbi:MAG: hypothetical protein M1823_004413 [Watsoniomyces obsoletus]|nr:MAG: hypothetical protein M1823_004413 [Watsoniomyces obsoletus]
MNITASTTSGPPDNKPKWPGHPINQIESPFLTLGHNEIEMAAYLGFENTLQLRAYITSDRFRHFFARFHSWRDADHFGPSFNVWALRAAFADESVVIRWELGKIPSDSTVEAEGNESGMMLELKQRKILADLMYRIILLASSPPSTTTIPSSATIEEVRAAIFADLTNDANLDAARAIVNVPKTREDSPLVPYVLPSGFHPIPASPQFVRDDLNESLTERFNRAWNLLRWVKMSVTASKHKTLWGGEWWNRSKEVTIDPVPFWMRSTWRPFRPETPVAPLVNPSPPLPPKIFKARWVWTPEDEEKLRARAQEAGIPPPQGQNLILPDPRGRSIRQWRDDVRIHLNFPQLRINFLILGVLCSDDPTGATVTGRVNLLGSDWIKAMRIFVREHTWCRIVFRVNFVDVEPPYLILETKAARSEMMRLGQGLSG